MKVKAIVYFFDGARVYFYPNKEGQAWRFAVDTDPANNKKGLYKTGTCARKFVNASGAKMLLKRAIANKLKCLIF